MTDLNTESNAPTMSATYDPADNKLRLSSLHRLDPETYALVKALGFAWAPKQELFIAGSWTPAREDLLLELCGEIDDEDSTLAERAEARAERFDDYHDKREAEAASTHKHVERIMDGIPMGQPILVGHHSEKHARKDAQRIEDGLRKAVSLWETAQYWQDRAKGALRHAKYKELPAVRARRIKTLEADLRKQQRNQKEAQDKFALWSKDGLTLEAARKIANFCHMIVCETDGSRWSAWDVLRPDDERYERCPAWTVEQVQAFARETYPPYLVVCQRWITHFENRIAYERALLGEVGGIVTDQVKPEKGGACMCWASPQRGWSYIVKVNKISVSVLDNWGNGGKNFTRTIPFDKLAKVMTAQDVQDLRDTEQLIEATNKIGFYRRGGVEHLPESVTNPEPPPEPTMSPAERACREDWTAQGVSVERQNALLAEIDAKAQLGTPIGPFLLGVPNPEPAPLPTMTPETVAALKQTLKVGVQVVTVDQLFPTPPALADRMVALAGIQPGQRVLEPSAGTGQILGALTHGSVFVNAVAVEISYAACDILRAQRDAGAYRGAKNGATVVCQDFLTCTVDELGTFDAIAMNPPFAKNADTSHVLHAMQFLKPGGRLVAITSAMAGQRTTKTDKAFQATMDALGATRELLPDGTFHDSGTEVYAALWVVRTPLREAPPIKDRPTFPCTAPGCHNQIVVADTRCAWCACPLDPADSMQHLAQAIATASSQTKAQIAKDRIEAAWRVKQQPRKPQGPPVGLFEQRQGMLF